jgi:hypothetical protein
MNAINLDTIPLASLEEAVAARRQQIQELTQSRGDIDIALARLQNGGAAAAPAPPARGRRAGTVPATRQQATTGRAEGRKTLAQFIDVVLDASPKPMTAAQIAVAVKKAGYKTKATKFEQNVYQALYHGAKPPKNQFTRIGKDGWANA